MKVVALMLGILISILALTPCSDDTTCEKVTSDYQTSADNHDHSEDEGDLCTPFCTCACCGCIGFVITSIPSFSIEAPKVVYPTPYSSYMKNFASSYFYSFWQPPKLSLS